MAALEAATHPARVGAPKRLFAPADAGAMGGRVKPGHDDGFYFSTATVPLARFRRIFAVPGLFGFMPST